MVKHIYLLTKDGSEADLSDCAKAGLEVVLGLTAPTNTPKISKIALKEDDR
ncbi:hypothetical protein [Gloeocapsa sp. PCC 7428]|uniref:hypothetical protein n=1 Tax=Gloeocapsa sp. PCC 7428 TaxID=1173026 RepID=UPI0012DBEAC8|nr:hypothetical protein [Gloeocapsa sp. PCC 7428]